MRYDDPQVQEALAGEYVVGALQGPARRRFESLMRTRPDLRRQVEAWEDRLTPLADDTPARTPPPRVLRAVRNRIQPETEATGPGFWGSLAFWRPFGAIAALLVVVMGGYAGFLVTQPGTPLPQVAQTATQDVLPSYVAVLEDDLEQPALVVTAYRGPWRLAVKPLQSLTGETAKVFQVWTVERGSGTIRPLLQLAGDEAAARPLDEDGWAAVKSSESLIVTLEPANQTPASPSGAVLFSGPCINLWEASDT